MRKLQFQLCTICNKQWVTYIFFDKQDKAWKYEDEGRAKCPNGHDVEEVVILE